MTKKKSSQIPIIEVSKTKPDLRKKEKPLVNLQVSNPVTYLKSWWKRVMGKEGIDFRFRIKPLTAIAIAIVLATFGFGVGRFAFSVQSPYIKYVPTVSPTPMPTPNPWRETAFSGTLRFSTFDDRFYLTTTSAEAISLEIPDNVDLSELMGRRIFATGNYNERSRVLKVTDAADLEVLPKEIEEVPVVTVTVAPMEVVENVESETPEMVVE
jgi:hypothetical protein